MRSAREALQGRLVADKPDVAERIAEPALPTHATGLDGLYVVGQSASARCDRPRDERVGSSTKTSTRTVVWPSSAGLSNPAGIHT